MNKINIDSKIKLEKDGSFYIITEKDETTIDISSNINANLIYTPNKKQELIINIYDNAILNVDIFSNNNIVNTKINLIGENSKVNYRYGLISNNNNEINVTINHNAKNTVSNITNHILNTSDNEIKLIVNGIIPKGMKECNLNQDNKIINLNDGTGIILPNLLIEEFDTYAEHAAYISKFNEQELFYLLSRGLTLKKAEFLLAKSFLIGKMNLEREMIEQIEETIFKNLNNIGR